MKFSTVRLLTVGAILMVFATSGEAGAEPGRSGWYIGGGIGANWTSRMDQEGWNRDNYCYPDSSSCDVPGPSENISGYRWMYDLDMDAGSAFEVSIGRMFNRWRLELSAAQRNNAIEQKFKSVTFLDGRVDTRPPGNRVESNSMSRIDDLTTRTLSLNAYYDFTNVFERITPYLGVGWGSRSSRYPASIFPPITRTRRILRGTCQSSTAHRTPIFPIPSLSGMSTPVRITA